MKRVSLGLALILSLSFPSGAQEFPPDVIAAAESIAPRDVHSHVAFLADDLLEGRDTGSRGHEIAARYVAAQLIEAGVEPAGDDGTWFQRVPLRSAKLHDGRMEIRVGDQWEHLRAGEDFVFVADPERIGASVEAQAVFVGFGVVAPEIGWDDYANVEVRDRIVIALRGAPSRFQSSSQRAHYASTAEKRATAAAHGAIALIELSSPREEKRVPWEVLSGYSDHPAMRWLDANDEVHGGLHGLEAHARVSRSGAEMLFDGAPVPLDELFHAADQGESLESFLLPAMVRLRWNSQHTRIDSPNVVGMIRGSDPVLRDEFVVLIAHLDHVGRRGDEIYNGAYDNASGVAAMLAVAEGLGRLEAPPRRSIVFLAVTAEEKGLLGADYFAHHPTEPVEDIVAAVSLDMFLMLFPLRDVVAFGAEHSSLGAAVEVAAGELGIGLSPDFAPEESYFVRTDHYPFVKRGIPALYLDHGLQSGDPALDGATLVQTWMNETYHKPADDLSQSFDWSAGADFARLNLLVAWKIASDAERPRWNEGDFFGERFGKR